jgi:hypothetical protein
MIRAIECAFEPSLLPLQIDLKHINQNAGDTGDQVEVGIDLREYYPSVEWDILGVPAERHEKYYPCCAEPYPGKLKKNTQHNISQSSL